MKTPPSAPELTCRELVELVSDYIERRLPLADRTRFEMHLCYCAPCKVYLKQIRATIETAGRIAEDDLSPRSRETLLATFRDWKKVR